MNANDPRRDRLEDNDALASLVRLAGRRPAPPPAAYEATWAAAHWAWEATVRRRRRRWVGLSGGVAAAAAAVLLFVFGPVGFRPVGQPAAAVALVSGEVWLSPGPGQDWEPVAALGGELSPGTRLRTGSGGVALDLAGGESLRLDRQTEITLATSDRVRLLAGGAYVDSGEGRSPSPVEIGTPAGAVRHVGTQFEVRYRDGSLRLRVREGRVLLDYAGGKLAANAGDEVAVAPDGSPALGAVTTFGEHWSWVEALAPMPGGDERTLASLLDWVSRETGRSVHFARPALEARARTTVLHGARRQMNPMEALAVMLETTDFQYTVTGGEEILIEERRF